MSAPKLTFAEVYALTEERMLVYKIVNKKYPTIELERLLKQWKILSDQKKTNTEVDRALKKIGKVTKELNLRLTDDIQLVNAFNDAFSELENQQ